MCPTRRPLRSRSRRQKYAHHRSAPRDAFDFTGRHVFVAGGTSGINLAIAEAFARRGAKVAVLSRSPGKVASAVKQSRSHGGEAMGQPAAARDPAAVAAALQAAHAKFGPIDVLVSG